MILTSILILGAIGVVAALLLYVVSRRFSVVEDPRIARIEDLLPGANCGSCGRSGCHDFAVACASASTLDGLNCPGAGAEAMKKIAEIVGLAAMEAEPLVAVVKCQGSCDLRPGVALYEGPSSCAAQALLGAGETACAEGCLGLGDCVDACRFGAIAISPETGLPVVDDTRCTGCAQCAAACPRGVIEMRPRGRRGLRVWVACNNHERGPLALKACKAACIACGKCRSACSHNAIVIERNLSWIDPYACRLCRKCVEVCPTKAILTANFPQKKTDGEA